MTSATRWTDDPIVRLEHALCPVVPRTAFWLLNMTTASSSPQEKTDVLNTIDAACAFVAREASGFFAPLPVSLSEGALRARDDMGVCLGKLRHRIAGLPDTPDAAQLRALNAHLQTDIHPLIEAGLDAFRENFIGSIVAMQRVQRAQTTEAINHVRKISKKIFFISINASIEAAHAGDHGRGFAAISQEIRSLSHGARSKVEDLANIAG